MVTRGVGCVKIGEEFCISRINEKNQHSSIAVDTGMLNNARIFQKLSVYYLSHIGLEIDDENPSFASDHSCSSIR